MCIEVLSTCGAYVLTLKRAGACDFSAETCKRVAASLGYTVEKPCGLERK